MWWSNSRLNYFNWQQVSNNIRHKKGISEMLSFNGITENNICNCEILHERKKLEKHSDILRVTFLSVFKLEST